MQLFENQLRILVVLSSLKSCMFGESVILTVNLLWTFAASVHDGPVILLLCPSESCN